MTRSVHTAIDQFGLFAASQDIASAILDATATNSATIVSTATNSILNISATATGTNASQDLTNTATKGLTLYLTVVSLTVNNATICLNVNGKDPLTGSYIQVADVSVDGISAGNPGPFVVQFYPGLTGSGQASVAVPPTFQVAASLTLSTTAGMTGTIGYKVGGARQI